VNLVGLYSNRTRSSSSSLSDLAVKARGMLAQ
jgi:hypothetical protein